MILINFLFFHTNESTLYEFRILTKYGFKWYYTFLLYFTALYAKVYSVEKNQTIYKNTI